MRNNLKLITKMKKLIKSIFIISFIQVSINSLYSEDFDKDKEVKNNRKVFHIYYTPLHISNYTSFPFRKRKEFQNFTFMYGLMQNLYIGITYNRGLKESSNFRLTSMFSGENSQIYEYSKSRESEYLNFKTQYFFWKNFYGSFNFGIEKGFTVNYKNYVSFSSNSIMPEPYNKNITYSDRFFTTIGLGYRREFFGLWILGIEAEFGIIQSGKINSHTTFNPQFYNGVPSSYFFENFFGLLDKKINNSEFTIIYIYSGVAL